MLLIGLINVVIGVCSYNAPSDVHQRIIPVLPPPTRAAGEISLADVPAAVMRAFAVAYPRHVATPRRVPPDLYELSYTDAGVTHRVTYRADGTFVSEK